MKRRFLFSTAVVVVLALAAGAKAQPLTALSTTNQLLRYNASSVTSLPTPIAITGLTGGETMLGIDYRPLNAGNGGTGGGLLYGVTSASRLYTLNTTTGAATLVATLSTALNQSGTNPGFAFDFNPVADRIRIIANRSGQNLRVVPETGVVTVDTTIPAYAAGDAFAGQLPNISAVGYTPASNGQTTLYGFDDITDRIVRITSPNAGTTVTHSGLGGINGNQFSGMDIGDSQNIGYLMLDLGGGVQRLYTIDLTVNNPNTNSSTLLGTFNIPGGLSLVDIALVPEPGTMTLCGLAAAGFAVYRRRKNRAQQETVAELFGRLAFRNRVKPTPAPPIAKSTSEVGSGTPT